MSRNIRHRTSEHKLPDRKIIEFLARSIRHLACASDRSGFRESLRIPLEVEDVADLLAA